MGARARCSDRPGRGRPPAGAALRQLGRTDIRVGAPLPWSCYDSSGHLLLRKGVCIAFEHQIDRLLNEGLFVEDAERAGIQIGNAAETEGVFERLTALAWGLRTLFNSLLSPAPAPDTEERLRARARKIIEACAADPNAAIAAVHLDFQNPYMLAHHAHSAVICALLGRRMGMSDEELMPVVCAALSFDLGLLELAYLEKQEGPLDGDQSESVRAHVDRTLRYLERAGVKDPVWLTVVRQHHERWNGSGYPQGVAGEEICPGARLLAIADSYTAMVRGRAFRAPRTAMEAQGEMFKQIGILYDESVCKAFIKEVGLYPPGSIVRLANGETSVVKERNRDGKPIVMSAYDAQGMPLMAPRRRDTTVNGFAVLRPLPQSECRSAAVIIRRLWL